MIIRLKNYSASTGLIFHICILLRSGMRAIRPTGGYRTELAWKRYCAMPASIFSATPKRKCSCAAAKSGHTGSVPSIPPRATRLKVRPILMETLTVTLTGFYHIGFQRLGAMRGSVLSEHPGSCTFSNGASLGFGEFP
jgi:hypothetical protein